MSELPYGTCPYNKDHRIMLLRMPSHIIKCAKNYKGPPLDICKYNATHRVLPEEMEDHLKNCTDFHNFNHSAYLAISGTLRKEHVVMDTDADTASESSAAYYN